MDKTLQTICNMLQSPDGMRRCAAAMVIAELRPKEDVVIKALGASLKDANQLLTRYVLEAFEALDSRAVVPYVLPLLEAPETETKLRAAAIIARTGGENVITLRGIGSQNIDFRTRHADFTTPEGVRWLGTSIASLSNLQP